MKAGNLIRVLTQRTAGVYPSNLLKKILAEFSNRWNATAGRVLELSVRGLLRHSL